ncbi:hypothetical protein Aph02nite_50280 [Actinoplanes philippinensis]|uniref:Uncharacterized protein n=1 Tax=Actinoplanes philippinensis TaxID=35752 RepID=A0A1I2IPS6_9ACTN|nr:hypothetical protein [Actinoplanes philippinensis]GIE79078.1 hypothetical protein Aph02nite_50280 [Actinoplanes philippinensis]SFF44422.1 hypothetical protein SAMN05421541_110334 [Actinoplanes philippinensis]
MSDSLSASERDDVVGLAVALMCAGWSQDEKAFESLLDGADLVGVIAFLTGLATQLGAAAAGGREQWAAMLAAWQPGQRLGDGLGGEVA